MALNFKGLVAKIVIFNTKIVEILLNTNTICVNFNNHPIFTLYLKKFHKKKSIPNIKLELNHINPTLYIIYIAAQFA